MYMMQKNLSWYWALGAKEKREKNLLAAKVKATWADFVRLRAVRTNWTSISPMASRGPASRARKYAHLVLASLERDIICEFVQGKQRVVEGAHSLFAEGEADERHDFGPSPHLGDTMRVLAYGAGWCGCLDGQPGAEQKVQEPPMSLAVTLGLHRGSRV